MRKDEDKHVVCDSEVQLVGQEKMVGHCTDYGDR